jgi:hypothetical protein
MKHAKPSISRPNFRVLGVALLAVAFIATFFGMLNVRANEQATTATPATQQVLGRVETCKLNTQSYCVINHKLGVKPTAVVVELSKTKQTVISVDVSSITDTSYKVTASVNGKLITTQPTLTFSAVYTYVGTPVTTTPSPSPTVTTPKPTTSPTAFSYDCNPSGEVAHFYPADSSNGQGQGSSATVGDPYNASAEQWAVKDDYLSNMCVYSKDNWYVDIKATNHGDGAVQAYPSMRLIYHDYGTNDFTKDPKLSSFPQLKVEFAVTDPADCTGCVYNDAFDIWLNGIGNGDTVTELMIWTHNQGQYPYGDFRGVVELDGYTWDLYYGAPGYIAFVPKNGENIKSGTLDLKKFIQSAAENHLITKNSSDPQVSQISYGVEPVTTKGVFKRWTFTKFNVLDK